MKNSFQRVLAAVLISAAFLVTTQAGIVRFTAIIDAAQETTGSDSTAIGVATMVYDPGQNTFDLTVNINGFTNTLNASHIHEGLPGMDGSPAVTLGAEANYTRDGESISGTFAEVEYTGDAAALLSGGTYLNFHTTPWPGGEVRGQLIPEPVKLTAIINAEQTTNEAESDAYGAAMGTYDPLTNELNLAIYLYKFTNTLTNSHVHEAPAGEGGSVVTPLGRAEDYQQFGETFTQTFEGLDHGGDPVALLSDGTYLNFHSDVFGPGEIRGQLLCADDETQSTRLINVSTRGAVGMGEEVMITGFVIIGQQPLCVLATGRGPFLSQFGVVNVLADPAIAVHDTGNGGSTLLMTNDNFADDPYGAKIIGLGLGIDLADATEAANLLILPPGAYTIIVSGSAGATGIALAEAYEAPFAFTE